MSFSPYQEAGSMVNRIVKEQKGLKALAYDKKGGMRCSKRSYALVCRTLQNFHLLQQVLEKVNASSSSKNKKIEAHNEGLLYVLLHELLLGPHQRISGGGKLKRTVMEYEGALRETLRTLQQDGATKKGSIISFPRYVRVNTLKGTLDEVVESLKPMLEGQLENCDDVCREIFQDPHVPNLLVLSPGFALHGNHELVQSGKVALQDKSSCFSALALVESSETGDVLDACAAPGNKTSHLAALLAESTCKKTTVYALDRDKARIDSLSRRMEQLVPKQATTSVVPIHTDFLKVTQDDHPSVRAILLDPSCTGSGILTTPGRWEPILAESEKTKADRIDSLANFQKKALRHAMTHFPKVTRVVYSTCSVNDEENEMVVEEVLQEVNREMESLSSLGKWKIVHPKRLIGWKRRGKAVGTLTTLEAECMIRVDGTQGDETNGFFICCFERATPTSTGKNSKATKQLSTLQRNKKDSKVPIYDGRFAVISQISTDKVEVAEKEKKSASGQKKPQVSSASQEASIRPKIIEADEKNIEPQEIKKNRMVGNDARVKSKIAKKIEKKLAWKRQQSEQKAERLGKKAL